MWKYVQQTGQLYNPDGMMLAAGYSGDGQIGKNNPTLQQVHDVGPIPVGRYTISPASDDSGHGPCVMRLTQDAANEMFGRDGFLMHGDLIGNPGFASKGCIIMPRFVRDAVNDSEDKHLQVFAYPSDLTTLA